MTPKFNRLETVILFMLKYTDVVLFYPIRKFP